MFLVSERWVEDGDRLLYIDPKFLWPWQHFFRILCGLLNRGSWEPKPSVWSWFWLQHLISIWNCNLNFNWLKPSLAPGYIIVWHPPASSVRTHLHPFQPHPQVKVLIRHPRPDAPFSSPYLHRCVSWLTARSRANMQQMETVIRVQILDEAICILHSTNTLRKPMNPTIFPSAMG